MSEPTRADLRMFQKGAVRYRDVTDAEFDAIARAEGYIHVNDAPHWDEYTRQWIAEHPAEAMRELFTEECGTCGGRGKCQAPSHNWFGGEDQERHPCPDCKDGRVLKDGVSWAEKSSTDPTPIWYVIPAEWMEASE